MENWKRLYIEWLLSEKRYRRIYSYNPNVRDVRGSPLAELIKEILEKNTQ